MTPSPAPDSDVTAHSEWLVNQIAHALRNPIFAALVQAESLSLKAASSPDLARSANLLHQQLGRLESTLEEMLLFGRLAPVRRQSVDLRRMLDEIAAARRDGERGEPAQVVVTGSAPPANLDQNAVRTILDRLIDNAVQHSPEPHLVELALGTTDGGWVRIEVRDSGDGIPAEIQEQMFEPFFPQHRGRPGLGLAVARKFARALGGDLTVESAPDRGTVATVELPPDGADTP